MTEDSQNTPKALGDDDAEQVANDIVDRQLPTSKKWRTSAAIAIGAFFGLSGFTFDYAKGTSYLSNDPGVCANCHVMQEHLDAWTKSSHGKFATCNDCHAPHDMVGKYYCKARNGLFHSLAFTTGNFPDRILMHDYNTSVVEQNCRDCHQQLVDQIATGLTTASADTTSSNQSTSVHAGLTADGVSCLHCHKSVGHDTGG